MEIKNYVKQYRDLQKSHKKVRLANFCRENMLDYYEMVEGLKHEKDSEILRLLNQIATDMIRKSDVDRIVKDAVDDVNAKWQKRFNDFQEETEAKYKKQMEDMAAEYAD